MAIDWTRVRGPAVLVRAVDADGEPTTDLTAVVDGDLIVTLDDGSTRLVPFARALACGPIRVTA